MSTCKSLHSKTQNKGAEKAFFDTFGEEVVYDVFTDKGYLVLINEFLKYFDPNNPNLRVIDMGCGTGTFMGKFLHYPFQKFGMDISPNCIELARKHYPKVHFDIGDIEKTQYEGNSFDVIFLSGVLHHFVDMTKVMAEAHRILKPGGCLLAYDPHKGNPVMWLYRCKSSPFYSSKGVTENEHPLSRGEIRFVLERLPFKEHRVYSVAGVTFKYVKSGAASFLLPAYSVFERAMSVWPLRDWMGSFLITYARK